MFAEQVTDVKPCRIEASLPHLDELVTEGLVILDDVDVVRYVARDPDDGEGPT